MNRVIFKTNAQRSLLLILSFFLLVICTPCAAFEDYQKIYDEQTNADFEYMFGIDPYQAEDYTIYITSPYPLFRTGVPFRLKTLLIPPGYYLLTPREHNGKQYVLFKENGRVKYIVPVYKEGIVAPEFYDKYIPVPKKTLGQKFVDGTNKLIAKISKKSMRTPPPKSYIDVNEIGSEFWEVILFYGLKQYHMLFKREAQQ